MASACKSLRECERWRASYSRTRDAAGLSNYELRGLTTTLKSRHATSSTARCWGRRVVNPSAATHRHVRSLPVRKNGE
ncbi:hypothetical protein K438DRAFT_1837699 [Mycena galopus ATCC 62051]|nr:hypothetical protein K438DRAFT_1837699 [Mycena galopus ATCC 62051]